MRSRLDWYMDNDQYYSKEFVEKIEQCIRLVNPTATPPISFRSAATTIFGTGNPSTKTTCARDIGLLNKDSTELGDSTRLYCEGIYSWQDLSIDLSLKRGVNKKENESVKPFVLLAMVFSKMKKLNIADKERFITASECYEYLSVLTSYSELDDFVVQRIVTQRAYVNPTDTVPTVRVAVNNQAKWTAIFNLFTETSLYIFGDNKSIVKPNYEYDELIDYIADKGQSISATPNQVTGNSDDVIDYMTTYSTGIYEIIPDLPACYYGIADNEIRNLFEYLFGVKYGPDKFDWRIYSATNNEGMYRIFFPLRNIVLYKIYISNHSFGEKLYDYLKANPIYVGRKVGDTYMVDIPFNGTVHTAADRLIKYYSFFTNCSNPNNFPMNRVYFGAPGTGKSNALEKDRMMLLTGPTAEEDYERVTFYPNYSYSNFVGTYKPVSVFDNGEEKVTYQFVPGPFMRIYAKALINSRTANVRPFLLIVEEINRANAAAVFGDFFQLLDRPGKYSEYKITPSEDIKKYLADELRLYPHDIKELKIPDNLFIWATMNSADQGVQPLDSAFKRRWDFKYMDVDANKFELTNIPFPATGGTTVLIEWNKVREAINNVLSACNVNEDKLLGPYYISGDAIFCDARDDSTPSTSTDAKNPNLFVEAFENKVLMYLFEDAGKRCRDQLFPGCPERTRYSSILNCFREKGLAIFGEAGSDSLFLKYYR